jgi:hypothetical protein
MHVNQIAPNMFSINDFTAGDNQFIFSDQPSGNLALSSPAEAARCISTKIVMAM